MCESKTVAQMLKLQALFTVTKTQGLCMKLGHTFLSLSITEPHLLLVVKEEQNFMEPSN